MIIRKKEKDRSGLIGKHLVCSVAVPQGQQSILKKGGNNDRLYYRLYL
ncbi:hypothetical protein ADIARSV_0558 [Arcticibacter svalbardensis MN12-7]|uniref:Uncharacterized protein n=1 Tax=Arcticibacter svalbardensis MN12-7 TaxID=1150600 RepID=R9GXD1_9SPHI|nr:hypothetical protein ADIARSV_0558 [Arcticibacter svalbardensis MN12-7]